MTEKVGLAVDAGCGSAPGVGDRSEAGVVTEMEEDAATERPVGFELCPTSPGRVAPLVVTFPGELDPRAGCAFIVPEVEVTLDRDETEAASPVSLELDQGRTEQVDRVAIPQIHLGDAPAADKTRHRCKVRRAQHDAGNGAGETGREGRRRTQATPIAMQVFRPVRFARYIAVSLRRRSSP